MLASVLGIGALSVLGAGRGAAATARELPLYFNPAPPNAHDLARSAIARIASGKDLERAASDLVRLGGAALPHVLPNLDALDRGARGRVALALAPVARRMGVASESELAEEEAAIAF